MFGRTIDFEPDRWLKLLCGEVAWGVMMIPYNFAKACYSKCAFTEEQEAAKAAARENASDELTPEQRAQDDYYKNVGVRLKRWRNMLSSTMGTAVP